MIFRQLKFIAILSTALVVLSCNRSAEDLERKSVLGRWQLKGHGFDPELEIVFDIKDSGRYFIESSDERFNTFSLSTRPSLGGFWEWNLAQQEITFYYGLRTIEQAIEYDQVAYWSNIVIDHQYLEASVFDGVQRAVEGKIILKKQK